jgi:hypothetical protein
VTYIISLFFIAKKGYSTALVHVEVLTDELNTFFCFSSEEGICLICHNSMAMVRLEEVFGILECTFAPNWSDQ